MRRNLFFGAMFVLVCAASAHIAWSQSTEVSGLVSNAGKPVARSTVTLTNAENGKIYKVTTDINGRFTLIGVPGGNYEVALTNSTGDVIFKQKSSVTPSGTSAVATLNIDISRAASPVADKSAGSSQNAQPKLTPEQVQAIKDQNAKATALNDVIKQANDAMVAKNWQGAIPLLQQLIAADPNNWQYYSGLGDAYLNLGQFDAAVQAYGKGITIADSAVAADPKNPNVIPVKTGEAKMLTNQGNAYLKQKKNNEAVAAYTKAAGMDPNPAVAYFNLCATEYNIGNVEGALAACDKAIAADPKKADAYFIKGSLLVSEVKTDPNNKDKYIAPPGTAEALKKYLELAPDGPHAADVKEMLELIGVPVKK